MSTLSNWSKQYEKCISCNSTEHPHKAKGLCTACYQKEHLYPQSLCNSCGTLARVHKRVNGKAVCRKCYKEPLHTCIICSKKASAAYKLNNTDFVCDSCYTRYYRKKQLCSICGHLDILAINNDDEKVCIKCYSTLNGTCAKCGRNLKSPYIIDGKHVCNRCYENARQGKPLSMLDTYKNIYVCSICGRSGVVHRIYNDNSIICQSCAKIQSNICVSCMNPALPIHSHLNALPYCRNCYYKLKFKTIIEQKKNNWSENFSAVIEDYFNSKAMVVSYENIWEQIKVSESLLNDLFLGYVNNKSKFTTSSLVAIISDYPFRKMFINDFIAFLCSKGILSDYQSDLILLNNLNEQIENLPIKLRNVVIAYRESLIKKYNKYKEKGWVGEYLRFSYYTCYLYILTALRFFSFANSILNIQEPTEIDNHTVDAYIRLKPYDTCNIRHFILFINKSKLSFARLTAPISNYKYEIRTGVSGDKQKQIIESCLYNENIVLRDRVILILMLLYGATAEEIISLKKDSFVINKVTSSTSILLYINEVKHEMPQIISTLILNYLDDLDENNPFVFPGRYYNTPISLSSICRIMKSFKVTSTELYYTAVSNAMLNGLHQPALLMKYFGICGLTASKYYKLLLGSEEIYE